MRRYEKNWQCALGWPKCRSEKKIAEKSDRVVPNYLHTCKNALGYLILALNAQYAERILNRIEKISTKSWQGERT